MDLAEFQRRHRVWPKIQLCFWGIVVWNVTEWAMSLQNMSNAQGAMVSCVYAAAAAYGKFYGETDPSNKRINI